MASKKIIAICQSGGEFVTNNEDGSLLYVGGEAYALDLDNQTLLNDFKEEVAENFECGTNGMTIKYFLPGNKKTLITISKDKDLKRMINFFKDSEQVEVFIIAEEGFARSTPNVTASRSIRTNVSEPAHTPAIPVDMIHPDDLFQAPADTSTLGVYPSSNDEKHRRAAMQWENAITGVGQRFNSFSEFREALHKYSIAHGFTYKYKKNESRRVTAKCKSEGCAWSIYASKLPTTELICIKTMNPKHTCDGAAVKAGGIRESLHDIFNEECHHGYCLRYLAEKLNNDLQGQFSHEARRLMIQDLYTAACAPTLESFERCAENIRAISPDAYDWVTRSEPNHWANALFGGARYGLLTSNFGQLFYDWVMEVNELPITQMVDVLRGKIMELIYTRRVESDQWTTRLTPLMEEKLQSETSKARSLQVLPSHGSTFEIRGESVDVVDVDQWDCSCKGWHLNRMPCCHAIAVFEFIGRSPYDYCSRYFSTESYHVTYVESINPVPNLESPANGELDVAVIITPPPSKRPPGRPKMKKVDAFDIVKRQMQCSRCKGLGHNKKTCGKVNKFDESDPLLLTGLVTEDLEGTE
ncbi:hypothetical protein RND71_032434 [Anisodus tanguticus]|uniref:SWIM-type domain-containing protein n=1 Tax=Anisodus tanguticus TaxID=243964 RepID=A0AAE1RCM5_9SOLA|nr:hypothetical protein RND71_032434 [Anisodus tanguticus]